MIPLRSGDLRAGDSATGERNLRVAGASSSSASSKLVSEPLENLVSLLLELLGLLRGSLRLCERSIDAR